MTAVRPPGMKRQPMMMRAPKRCSDCSAQARLRAPRSPAKTRRPAAGPKPAADQVGGVVAEERAACGQRDQHGGPRIRAARGGDAERDHRGLAGQHRDERVERGQQDGDDVGQRGRHTQVREPGHRAAPACAERPGGPVMAPACFAAVRSPGVPAYRPSSETPAMAAARRQRHEHRDRGTAVSLTRRPRAGPAPRAAGHGGAGRGTGPRTTGRRWHRARRRRRPTGPARSGHFRSLPPSPLPVAVCQPMAQSCRAGETVVVMV